MAAAELQRRLDLSPEQRRQVEAILVDSHREAQVPWNEFRTRLMQIVESANDRIEKILTPAQRPEFLRYRAERHDRLHHGLHAHGLAPGGGPDPSAPAPGAPSPH